MSDKLSELKNAAIEAEGTVENLKAELSALESAETVDKDAVKAKKADLRKAESALKKANTAVTKEEAAIERNAEREAKKAAKQAEREANRMPEQNGIRRPKPDTLCGRAWQIADDLSAKFGQPTPIKDLLEAAEAEGLNAGNVKAEYARWRKFYGITGRVALPKEEAATE